MGPWARPIDTTNDVTFFDMVDLQNLVDLFSGLDDNDLLDPTLKSE